MDLVYVSAEGRALGAMEARSEHFVDLAALDRRNKTGVQRIVSLQGGIAPVSKA
ncbi:hypothetical protein JQK88_15980 [Mesorhizobium caraganae]|uniref:hypothetical protein n=1 Tax=Mesorhizobium caraganae TaxID=483206 RepID=UPI00193937A3|nr:hypothetical protein [Mesorhizobium caraganae]MBM2712723.1 hypothetical protein [Mesorhizobium caraganae]